MSHRGTGIVCRPRWIGITFQSGALGSRCQGGQTCSFPFDGRFGAPLIVTHEGLRVLGAVGFESPLRRRLFFMKGLKINYVNKMLAAGS